MSTQKNVASLLSFFLLLHLPNKLNAVGPCIYDLDPRGVIDLTPIGNKDGTARWEYVDPQMSDGHGNCGCHLIS
jgi:hypothetical protein